MKYMYLHQKDLLKYYQEEQLQLTLHTQYMLKLEIR